MKFLKENLPVLLSKKFWGLAAYILLSYLEAKGLLGGEEIVHLTQLVGLATGVGVADSVARKISLKK